MTEFEGQARAVREAFAAAVDGRAEIPPYQVTTGPDGEFLAVPDRELDDIGRALLAGDCRRRFIEQARTGVDGFAGMRRAEAPPTGSPDS